MMALKRIRPGVYETFDGKYRVEHISLRRYERGHQRIWITYKAVPRNEWEEIYSGLTKKACVEFLTTHRRTWG